jgi:regulation of enolase protein 1 (concanavalin A-like superfamily)
MDAPRLLMQVEGDFAVETRLQVYPRLREHGGILIWKSPEAYLRLEKTSGAHSFRGDVRFERHVGGIYTLVGRAAGFRNLRQLFLRVERRGNQFSGFASMDGQNWSAAGVTYVGTGDPLLVGLHALCPGNIPPTLTRFDYFRFMKRKAEAATYKPVIQERLPEEQEEAMEREQAETFRQLI